MKETRRSLVREMYFENENESYISYYKLKDKLGKKIVEQGVSLDKYNNGFVGGLRWVLSLIDED